jgi:protocatechuate 3,4-dioxygenase beta subunit
MTHAGTTAHSDVKEDERMSMRRRTRRIVQSSCTVALMVAALAIPLAGTAAAQEMAIDLSPSTATNTVGTDHAVTATVTEDGSPAAGVSVHFDVTGDGTPTPASGDSTTDGAGQAVFTFTNETPGTNTITGCIDDDESQTCDSSTVPGSISFVGANSAAGNTVTIPAHQVGDLMIIYAYRNGNATPPGSPSGWTDIGTPAGSQNQSDHTGYRFATSTSDTSGTWTNATNMVVLVYRGIDSTTPIGGDSVAQSPNAASNVISYPAVTMSVTDGSSWVVGLAGHRTATNVNVAPTGMTNRTGTVVAGHDTNVGVTAWSLHTVTVNASSSWRARTIEIVAERIPTEPSATATKTWVVGAPAGLDLAPATSTNTVGTPHDMTATLSDGFGNPIEGAAVHFAVTGDGSPDPAVGDDATDADGEVTFSFTNETVGANTITACVDEDVSHSCDVGELTTTATKTWLVGAAADIDLSPPTDANPVGTDHDMTATVTDEFGNAVEGVDVHFDVNGNGTPDPAADDDTTDADGEATFSFTNETAGTDTITACIDDDSSHSCEIGETIATATKTWLAGAAAQIDLAPETSTNTVGTPHDMTATVTDSFGNPVEGATVHFDVTGAGSPDPSAGDDTTDADGEATFSFTNETAGADTIAACVDEDANQTCDLGESTTTATKTWEAGAPAAIDLTPATDTNVVGTSHPMTATVTDEFGNPVEGADVHFDVDSSGSPDPVADDDATGADGTAAFTFTNDTPGTDTITACVDEDISQSCDLGETSDTATKTWMAGAPAAIDLTPATDTNTVDTPHDMIATVTDTFDNPIEGVDVHFAVAGSGTPTPAAGDDTTDADGMATFSFTNDTAGSNTITACVDEDVSQSCDLGETSDTATKSWEAGPAADIALAPSDATNPVGSDHTLTATVTDEFGNPVADTDVHFDVDSAGNPNPATGDDTTGSDGTATFTFTNDTGGTDTITACIDVDSSQSCDVGETLDTATKTWVLPTCPGFASDPRHQVVGTPGDDVLIGTPGRDIICGLEGADVLRGLGDNDVLIGGAGNDRLVGGGGNDRLVGRLGRDALIGRGGKDRLLGRGGDDRLVGGIGRDLLRGGSSNDRLLGRGGNDRLYGNGGDDFLDGGRGVDLGRGGPGDDVIVRCER